MTQTETDIDTDWDIRLQIYKCKICGNHFTGETITAWEIHKLNHTLVALKNIIDRAIQHGDRLY